MTTTNWHKSKFERNDGESALVITQSVNERVAYLAVSVVMLLAAVASGWGMIVWIHAGRLWPLVLVSPLFVLAYDTCWSFFNMVFTRLVVSPEGIEYHIFGKTGFAFWHDMECFDYRYTEEGIVWGIVLNRQVCLSQNRLDPIFAFFEPDSDFLKSFIPLSRIVLIRQDYVQGSGWVADLGRFESTTLGEEILRYAPHLFEQPKRKVKE